MAKINGIKIVHGCRSAFHNDKYEEFKSIYEIINNWKFDSNLKDSLLIKIKNILRKYSLTNCGKSQDLFTKHLSKEISSLNYSNKYLFHIAFIFNLNSNFIQQSYILLKSISLFYSNKINQIHLHIIINDQNAQEQFSKQVEIYIYLLLLLTHRLL